MITQLSLSVNTVRNLRRVNPNQSHAIEWIIRSYMTDGFPSPYVVNDRSPKQVVNVNLSPYAIGILEGFGSFGMNQSQVVEWLAKVYVDSLKAIEPHEPKVPKVKQPKSSKAKRERTTYPEKEPFVHTQESGPVMKKVKIRPVKR